MPCNISLPPSYVFPQKAFTVYLSLHSLDLDASVQLAKLNLDDLANKFPSYTFLATARDLGVLLDQELSFAPHLHRLSRDCYYQLRQLRTVARSLTASAATTLVHAFITSRLDYCSTLYTGLPA